MNVSGSRTVVDVGLQPPASRYNNDFSGFLQITCQLADGFVFNILWSTFVPGQKVNIVYLLSEGILYTTTI